MKAFLLDPQNDSSPMPGLLSLGAARAGWKVSRAAVLGANVDGMAWLARLRSELEEADMIVGLGNFLALMQSGSELSSVLALLSRKIESGCPALFDGCSSLLNGAFPEVEHQIRGLFDSYGIHITRTKVASTVRDYEAHSSSMCCAFYKDDDTLLDPRLFDNVDRIVGSSSRLIQYDSDVFPAVEASGVHFFVDEGDLLTVGNMGKKNAVAAHLARGKKCLLVLSGSYLRDRTATFGGLAPGCEDNRKFAENVIDELTARVRRPVNYSLSAYEIFCELEARLGEMIEQVLTRLSGGSALCDLLPNEVRGRIRTDSGMLDYGKAMYRDLVLVLDHRWPDFQSYFVANAGGLPSRGAITALLLEINELRKYLAHPIKAKQDGRTIATGDVEKLKSALELVRLASVRVSEGR
jgi:hypothetical protein